MLVVRMIVWKVSILPRATLATARRVLGTVGEIARRSISRGDRLW
jgi:hypothetical protein